MQISPCAQIIAAIVCIPIADLEDAFGILVNQTPADLNPVLDWFEDNYLGRAVQNQRSPPLFPREMRNVHNRVR